MLIFVHKICVPTLKHLSISQDECIPTLKIVSFKIVFELDSLLQPNVNICTFEAADH